MTMADDLLAGAGSKDLLYQLVYRLVRERLPKTPRVLTEAEVLKFQERRLFPDSYWSAPESGYRLALAKVWQGTEMWAWVVVVREIQGKLMESEIETIERAVGDALGTRVEAMPDPSGRAVVHCKGVLN